MQCTPVHALLRSTCELCLRILTKPRQVYSKQTNTESFPRQPLRQQQSPSGPICSYSSLRRLTVLAEYTVRQPHSPSRLYVRHRRAPIGAAQWSRPVRRAKQVF